MHTSPHVVYTHAHTLVYTNVYAHTYTRHVHIQDETNVRVHLRGKGISQKDGSTNGQDLPPHLLLTAKDDDQLQRACELARNLIEMVISKLCRSCI